MLPFRMHEDGVIKYYSDWTETPPPPCETVQNLNLWRQKLFELNLIGSYPDGIGYGNVSQRAENNTFWISGTQTGSITKLEAKHYSLVTTCDIQQNKLTCTGPAMASSESLTHGAIYQCNPAIQAVFHVHSLKLWKELCKHGNSTPIDAQYGTPEIATSVQRLVNEGNLGKQKIFAMGGHKEGVISFGMDTDEAGEILLKSLHPTTI